MAVALAVLTGVVIAAVAEWVLFVAFHPQRGGTSVDVTKLALTVVGGVGGVVALVIAYRRQRDLEQGRFVERFSAAAAQLGATDVAVRIAGVYAMAGVADESDGLRRQQCIDVLCGYLRLPYDPEQGSSGRTKRVVTTSTARPAEDLDPGKVEEHQEYRQNDREVRATILRVIAGHLRPPAEYSWSTSDFDFRTAHLEDADLSKVRFSGIADFGGAIFSGETSFSGAIFSGETRFTRATFFSEIWFDGATFSNAAWFGGAIFSSEARFNRATFSGETTFNHAIFSGETWFDSATFSGETRFTHVTFSGATWFNYATFSGEIRFNRATFSSGTRFTYARFSGVTTFSDAAFIGSTWFRGTAFSGDVLFREVDFGSDAISFELPRQWGPPAPEFDWDEDLSRKPNNVEPRDWPPTVATPPGPPDRR